jgi:biotin carboxylase
MPSVLVILPTATYRATDFVTAAAELGLRLVVASDAGHALADRAGAGFVEIDCSQPEAAAAAIVAYAEQHPLDAVVAADDRGVVAASLAAERLGLPHNPPEAARATRDKAVMRGRLEAAGVSQPRWALLEADAGADSPVGYPCVVKPLDMAGSCGVIRCDRPAELAEAVGRIRSILTEVGAADDTPLIVEEYVPGDEVVVEGLVGPDGLEVLAVLDKPDRMEGPYFEETIFQTPSRLGANRERIVVELTELAVAALGLAFGPVHAEVRIEGDEAAVIEIAARSIGGLCGRSLRFGLLGTTLEHLLLRAAVGLPRRAMHREERASGVMMLPIPAEGVLREIRWKEAALEVPGITGLEITVPIGTRVRPLPEGDRYLGFLFASAESPDEVEASLREAHGLLDIEISP